MIRAFRFALSNGYTPAERAVEPLAGVSDPRSVPTTSSSRCVPRFSAARRCKRTRHYRAVVSRRLG